MPKLSDFSFKSHIVLFCLVCLIVGILFAFVIDANWSTVAITSNGQEFVLPTTRSLMMTYSAISFLCMGFSYAIISEHPKRDFNEIGIFLFWAQFFLILIWLGIFFGLHLAGLALIVLFGTAIMLAWTISVFQTISMTATALLFPYISILIMVAFLNIYVFMI